jgi:hypothetical protein
MLKVLDPMILKGMLMSKKSSHIRVGGCDEILFDGGQWYKILLLD